MTRQRRRSDPPAIRPGTCPSTAPIDVTWLPIVIPKSASSFLQTAPQATRAAVSRALGPLEDVAGVAPVVLQQPHEVRMARPREVERS